jgi:hypothetical protein
VHPFAQAIASGAGRLSVQNPHVQAVSAQTAHSAFINGLNGILFVAAFVLFTGAILVFVLVRQRDFVASGPAVEPAAG